MILEGAVKQDGEGARKVVRAYDFDSGALLTSTYSQKNGRFTIEVGATAKVLVIAFSEGYQPSVHGPINMQAG